MKNGLRILVLAIAAVSLLAGGAFALNVKLEKVVSGVNAPMKLISVPDGSGRRVIVEQTGLVRVLNKDGSLAPEPFLDLTGKMVAQHDFFDERGLLSIAFHPDFKSNGKFYVYYSTPLRTEDLGEKLWYDHSNVVAEFTAPGGAKADPSSERDLITQSWPQFNHNGGDLAFGPDGYLYISMGDGGYADDYGIGHNKALGNGQDLSVLLGKVLRIDVNGGDPYNIPKDNPFVGNKKARPEIYAYGLRNPWRMSFDMGGSHELFVGNVGQNSYEEVELIKKGENHGWRRMEGTHCFDWLNPNKHPSKCNKKGLTMPIMEYNNCNVHKNCKGLSITGGYVYRGSHKAWQGKYFFGDWSSTFGTKNGQIFVGTRSGKRWTMEDVKITNMSKFNEYVLAFGQDSDGNVYVMTTGTTGPTGGQDTVYMIVP